MRILRKVLGFSEELQPVWWCYLQDLKTGARVWRWYRVDDPLMQ